ncbi:AbrB family transcriptional regulator [Pseudomonas gingeri]|uniref:AbrB family transcriptional regulator n=1 Tax=Pseudomonas gingeri TaxID=117681 RepID=UPI0015A4CCD5|nr:AbrB family transcriptional regulator [Pseudomonas gingeri]NWA02551.1 AbrB family transcriptional regulator [Pseudomonas gingeri]NWA12276.1 AbrB family transcriptional regulator [Pseudomonas gingeri]NWA57318.1 AbrB family transcriptional regulator [Pseudomonas gingeri]NWA93661.1 AbrB family transcriptional regulator [Pseudomonas gingeri]NWB03133.1 AbrB family transcriptional regulator [Pseudomonas gingeri]
MPASSSSSSRFSLTTWPRPLQWLALIILAGTAGQLLKHASLPAGQFIGPMLVAIGFGVSGANIRIHRQAFRFGQGCIGLLAAHSMTLAVLTSMAESWHLMLFATVLTVCLSSLVGLAMVRFGGIQASTAAWGTSPGAASAMVLMADDFGADGRVVATMQYVRVVCVVVIGALVSHVLEAPANGSELHATQAALHGFSLVNLGLTLATVALGVVLGARIPAGALLVPLLIGGVLQLSGLLHITLPAGLLAVAYGAIGCFVGLRFDRPTVLYVWKRLPTMILGAISLIALCAASAWVLAKWLGLDFLSVYLATSPGGLDTMAIIAVDTHSDVGLVLAMQTLRLLAVIFTGAFFARLVIRFAGQDAQTKPRLPA